MNVIHVGAQGLAQSQQGVETDIGRAANHLRRILKDTKGHFFKIGISGNPTGRS